MEQNNYRNAEALRKQLEVEIREISVRLEEAESFAAREGKRIIAKLQARVSTSCYTVNNMKFNISGVWELCSLRKCDYY